MRKLSVLLLPLLILLAFLPASAQQNVSSLPPCSLTAQTAGSTITATAQIIAAPAATNQIVYVNGSPTTQSVGQRIEICAVYINVKQAAGAADYRLVTGTGTNCGTGQVNLTATNFGTASVIDKTSMELSSGHFIQAPRSVAVCLFLSAAPTNAQVTIVYRLRSS